MSPHVRPHWSVQVSKPRKDEGEKLRLRIRPNTPLLAAGHRERRLAVNTTDPAAAAAMAKEWERKLNARFGGASLTVSQVFDKHLAWREADPHANPSTTASYRLAFRYLRPELGATAAEDVSAAAILRTQDRLQSTSGLNPSTINLYMRCGAASWRWANKRGIVAAPWTAPDALKKIDGTKRPLTPVELEDFLEWLSGYQGGRWTTIFRLLANTSCRASEILLLREGQLDRTEGVLLVLSHRNRDGAKQNKAVAVDPEDAALVPVRQHGELLFPSFTGDATRPVSREQLRRVLKTWAEQKLADPENIDTHSLRRTFISHLRRALVPDAIGQRQAGIKDTHIYVGYDRNTVGDDLRECVKQVKEYRREVVRKHREKPSMSTDAKTIANNDVAGNSLACHPPSE